jgi:hypothetical protein
MIDLIILLLLIGLLNLIDCLMRGLVALFLFIYIVILLCVKVAIIAVIIYCLWVR